MNEQLRVPRMIEAFEHFAGSVAAVTPGSATGWRGTLTHIHIAEAASYEMEELQEASCIAGRGIEGDRCVTGAGTSPPKADVGKGTLLEQEVIIALARHDPPLQGG